MESLRRKVAVFHDRYPLIGPTFWVLSIQYFVTQIVVALHWAQAYSLRFNTISDLGNSACGQYMGAFVCSPLHNAMNASFIVLGMFIVAGSLLLHQEFRDTPASAVGFTCMALAGLGTLFVGIFPENGNLSAHVVGAALPFIFGNTAMVILGVGLKLPQKLRVYSVLSGLVGLGGLVLFASDTYLGLGKGGMERITAYPQTIWLIAFGLYMSRDHYVRSRRRHPKNY